jgi:Ran GTPase-activating protein (RanGAP) involved in mRNA processing and transport
LRELAGSKTIRKLNLSRNCIGDNSAPELGNLLSNNKSIVEIYLHWNWLHGTAGRTIAQVLASNDSLKILDLSYNSLGVMKES